MGVAIGLAETTGRRLSITDGAVMVLQALPTSALVLPAVILLRTRVDHRSLPGADAAR